MLEVLGESTGLINVSASPKVPILNISCKVSGAPFTCSYGATGGMPIKFTGGEPAKLPMLGVGLTKASGQPAVCLESGTMSAEYQSTDPVLFMTSS